MSSTKVAADNNIIASILNGYKKVIPSPLFQAGLTGLGIYGLTRFGWNRSVDTLRALGRLPAKKYFGLNDGHWDIAMDNLKYDNKLAKWVPIGLSAVSTALMLAPSYSPYKKHYGLTQWNAPSVYNKEYSGYSSKRDANRSAFIPMTKTQSVDTEGMTKIASQFFNSTGYDLSDLDLNKVIDVGQAKSLFSNDPYLAEDTYTKNFGNAIISNAANNTGVNNPTLGNIMDSAVDKMSNKLSLQGIANVGLQSVAANTAATLFTGVLDTMLDLSPTTRRNIIETGTWAGTINAILN